MEHIVVTLEEATIFLANSGYDPHINDGATGKYLRVGARRIEHSDAVVTYEYMAWIYADQNRWAVLDLSRDESKNYSTLAEATLATDRLLREQLENKEIEP